MDILLGYTECQLQDVSVHHVGNKTNEEEFFLSTEKMDISNDYLKDLLVHFFLHAFEGIEYYQFIIENVEGEVNKIFNLASQIFENPESLHDHSKEIAQHLYDSSTHPNIKPGDLFVAYLTNIHVGDILTNAIGIFKAENKHSFLKLNSDTFDISFDDGINIDKLDKGCLIFDIDQPNGYRACIVNKANRSVDAQYWRDIFLQLMPLSDNFNSTKEFLNLTKKFITRQVPEEFEVSRTDKIDLMNRSLEYFQNNEAFYKEDFESEVLQDDNLIQSFRNYDSAYQYEQGLDLGDHFGISDEAVKKQTRAFKSVIKLDKNFHIYVHGNKNLIEQGIDDSGRKYYKIYFENEL